MTNQINFKYFYFFIFIISNALYSQSSRFIDTNPSFADVLNENDSLIGKTPFNIIDLNNKTKKIKLVKDGFGSIELNLKEKRRDKDPFLDIIVDCSGCLIDADFNIERTTFKFLKKFKEEINTVLVGIKDPILQMDENSVLGKINGAKKKLKDKNIFEYLGYPENMEFKVLYSFKNSYIEPIYFNDKSLANDVSNLQNPKIVLKPIVKKLEFDLKGNLLRDYSGKCFLECEWQLFDISDLKNSLKSITIKTSNYRTGNNYELILHEMISLSERQLLEDDSLYSFLLDAEKNHLDKSKGEEIKISLSHKLIYANISEMLKETISSVVTIETQDKFGSGVFISENGHILTNYHVIEGRKNIYVKIANDKKLIAEIVKYNKDFDLAILKINLNVSNGLSFCDDNATNLGEDVYAIGTPLDKKLQQSVSKGIISGYRAFNGVNFIQTDVNINSGNSGGPLLNAKGQIIGINTLKLTGKNVSGIGFSIPSAVVLEMLNIKN